MFRVLIVTATLAIVSVPPASAQGLPAPPFDPGAAQVPVDGGPFPFPSGTPGTFEPSFDASFGRVPDPGFGVQPGSDPTAAQMRERVERATVIPSQDPNASSMFGGQLSSQNAAVEQDRRSRLIDELSLLLRSRGPIPGGPRAETAGGSVFSGDD